jgi:hypothetical protein
MPPAARRKCLRRRNGGSKKDAQTNICPQMNGSHVKLKITLLLFKDGMIVDRMIGPQSIADLENTLGKAASQDASRPLPRSELAAGGGTPQWPRPESDSHQPVLSASRGHFGRLIFLKNLDLPTKNGYEVDRDLSV